ncbi:MAG TPA: 50S ribosomal protein L15 [Armatimonadota bacterium]|nr:50S ribosomal protein L15 [Armatimonadota bacterium]
MSEYLSRLRPAAGSVHVRKRVGRGIGSGTGKTAARGMNGQKKREAINPGYEGGQTPLARRLPRLRGFKALNHKEFSIVNVAQLGVFEANAQVTPESLLAQGLIKDVKSAVKILGDGELSLPLQVSAHKFSASAAEKIRAAGGSVEVIPAVSQRGQPEADAA